MWNRRLSGCVCVPAIWFGLSGQTARFDGAGRRACLEQPQSVLPPERPDSSEMERTL